MRNKGDIKTQQQYDKELELRELYREAYLRAEMTQEEIFSTLVKVLGFGKTIAKRVISEWEKESSFAEVHDETLSAKKKRLKRQMSLEKYCKVIKYGRQYENEIELKDLYKEAYLRAEMTQKEIFSLLVNVLDIEESIAEKLISEWRQKSNLEEALDETFNAKQKRLKRQMSLEKYFKTRK